MPFPSSWKRWVPTGSQVFKYVVCVCSRLSVAFIPNHFAQFVLWLNTIHQRTILHTVCEKNPCLLLTYSNLGTWIQFNLPFKMRWGVRWVTRPNPKHDLCAFDMFIRFIRVISYFFAGVCLYSFRWSSLSMWPNRLSLRWRCSHGDTARPSCRLWVHRTSFCVPFCEAEQFQWSVLTRVRLSWSDSLCRAGWPTVCCIWSFSVLMLRGTH